jgi:hypothetical protein
MFSLTITGLQKIIPPSCWPCIEDGSDMQEGTSKICLIRNKEDWDLALPYIAMGYKMSKHASLFHFSLYFLLFGRHPIPPFSIVAQMDQVVDLDSPTTWAKVIAKKAALFRRVMPMAMKNLSIA